MGFNKAYVEGSMYNLVTIEECFQNPSLYDRDNAVIINYRGIDVILPIRVKIFDRTLVGVYHFYNDQPIIRYRFPYTPEEFSNYSAEGKVANFEGTQNMYQMIQESNKLRAQEFQYLTNPDNVYEPIVGENDAPHMKQLKMNIGAKKCDLNRYASRFGQFANDKRKLKEDNITLEKLITFYQNIDISSAIITWDNNPNVPNPTKKVSVSLLSGPDAGETVQMDPEQFFDNVKEVLHYNG